MDKREWSRWVAIVAVLAIVASKAYTSGMEHGARPWRKIAADQDATMKELRGVAAGWEDAAERALDAVHGWERRYCELAQLVVDNGLVPGWELPPCCGGAATGGEDLAADRGKRP